MKFKKAKKHNQTDGRKPRNQSSRTAPVFSYYSNRTAESTGTFARAGSVESVKLKNSSPFIKYMPSLISMVLVLAALAYVTTLSTQPKIIIPDASNVSVVVQSTVVYETAAKEILQSTFANRSKITINTNDIAQRLKKQFPELGDVVVAIPLFGRRPIIEARPAVPKLILVGNGGSFVVDTTGTPVLKASQLASSVRDQLPVVSDSSDTPIELGKQILTTDLVSFISHLKQYFAQKNLSPESITLPALANEVHVKPAGEGYYIKFNTESDVRQQVGSFIAVQEQLDSNNQTPREYIDVRVEERAYIK